MEKQKANRVKLLKQIMKAYENHQLDFSKYDISNKDNISMALFLGDSRGLEIIVFLSLR